MEMDVSKPNSLYALYQRLCNIHGHGLTSGFPYRSEHRTENVSDSIKYANTWGNSELKHDVWTKNDGKTIRDFYESCVNIRRNEWDKNCRSIDLLLEYLFKSLNEQVKKDYPYLELCGFERQGSARDGLKVGTACEFDAVLLFKFVGFGIEVIECPQNDLPPGIAEIRVTKNTIDTIDTKPTGLIQQRKDGKFISSKIFHDTLFKRIIDKAIIGYQSEADEARRRCHASINITRKSNAPAMTLSLNIADLDQCIVDDIVPRYVSISVDIVPGYLINSDGNTDIKQFLVTRWIPESLNNKRRVKFSYPESSWRISHSYLETMVVEDFQKSTDINAHRLMTACKVLKALHIFDIETFSSPFQSIVKSYHIKTILLYSLLFTKVENVSIPSVSAALGNLIAIMRIALSEGNLPQFFTNHLALKTFFPTEPQYKTDNLLAEKSPTSLEQAFLDMKKIIQESQLENVLTFTSPEIEKFFKCRIDV